MLEDLTPPKRYASCRFARLRAEFDSSDQEILDNAVVDPRWTPASLSTALRQKGIVIAADTIRTHLRGQCGCSKT